MTELDPRDRDALMKHMEVLLESGALDVGNGKVEIDFFEGVIVSVRRIEQVYARRKQLSTPPPLHPKNMPV